MKNMSDTDSYTFVDHMISRSVYSLSRVIGVRNVLRPFWNRWRAMGVPDETLQSFLGSIDGLANWPEAASAIVAERLAAPVPQDPGERIAHLRATCAIATLAQWGCLALDEVKADLYRIARDTYVEAEREAFGDRFRRIAIPWEGGTLWGNLHLPAGRTGPAVILIHGMDDSKEEHLATELYLMEQGFRVLCLDGPGQGEALTLDRIHWPSNFHHCVPAAIDALDAIEPRAGDAVGVVGISWGGFWIYRAAAVEPRVAALYDLGGPIHSNGFARLPFHLKSKFCQVMGVTTPEQVAGRDALYSLLDDEDPERSMAPVRIMHGGRDPIVPVRDKEWLVDRLRAGSADRDVTIVIEPAGDHCCTGHAEAVRSDAAAFFARTLCVLLPRASNQESSHD